MGPISTLTSIPEWLNMLIAIVIGIGFGFALELPITDGLKRNARRRTDCGLCANDAAGGSLHQSCGQVDVRSKQAVFAPQLIADGTNKYPAGGDTAFRFEPSRI